MTGQVTVPVVGVADAVRELVAGVIGAIGGDRARDLADVLDRLVWRMEDAAASGDTSTVIDSDEVPVTAVAARLSSESSDEVTVTGTETWLVCGSAWGEGFSGAVRWQVPRIGQSLVRRVVVGILRGEEMDVQALVPRLSSAALSGGPEARKMAADVLAWARAVSAGRTGDGDVARELVLSRWAVQVEA